MEGSTANMILEEPSKIYDIRHRSYQFSKEVIDFVRTTTFDKIYFSIFDQFLRSATSVGANLIEGKASPSTKDFLKFYTIALKSANETKYWLCLLRDAHINVEKDKVADLLKEADEISKIIASIIIRMKAQ